MLVSLVLIGLMASILLPLPSRHIALTVFGSDLAFDFSGAVQLVIILTALVSSGVDGLLRARAEPAGFLFRATFWGLPAFTAIGGLLAVHSLAWWGYQIFVAGLTGALLVGIVLAQLRTLEARPHHLATLFLTWVVYLAALGLYVALYGARLRSLVSATGILAVSAILSLELYRHTAAPLGRVWLYGLLSGLMMGELTWGLNYTRLNGRLGGAFLLLAFYMITGLVRQHLWGRLTRRVALEFAALGALGMAALAWLVAGA